MYVAVFVGLRLAATRELGQMTVFDLVVVLLIANAVDDRIGSDCTELVGVEVVAGHTASHATLAACEAFTSWAGSPTTAHCSGPSPAP